MGTADFIVSIGCRLAPVIKASKNRTATVLGGVSLIVRLIGTPLLVPAVEAPIDPPQDTRRQQAAITRVTQIAFRMYSTSQVRFTNTHFGEFGSGQICLTALYHSCGIWLPGF